MFVLSFAISDTWSGHIARSELEHETMELSTDIDDLRHLKMESTLPFIIKIKC